VVFGVVAEESTPLTGSAALLFGGGGTTLPADDGAGGVWAEVTSAGAPPSTFEAGVGPVGSRSTTNAPTPPSASAASPIKTAGTTIDRVGMSAPLTERAAVVP